MVQGRVRWTENGVVQDMEVWGKRLKAKERGKFVYIMAGRKQIGVVPREKFLSMYVEWK
jgi:hypothetical protein